MLMRIGNPVRIHEGGGRQGFDAAMPDLGRRRQDLHPEAAFFLNFTVKSLLGILIELDMTADRKPFVVFFMIDQKNLVSADNKNRDNEIVKLINMRQGKLYRFEIIVADNTDRALGERNEPVVVFFHEAAVKRFGFPKIKGGILVFFIGAQERVVSEKPGMLGGFFGPELAILDVNRDILPFDLKKDLMDEHSFSLEAFSRFFRRPRRPE